MASSTAITASEDPPLYTPPSPQTSRTFHFLRAVNAKYNKNLSTYAELYAWSTDRIDDFWSTVWDETGIIGDKGTHVVDADAKPAANPTWFAEARLNWAENMLQSRSPDKIALVQASVYLRLMFRWHVISKCYYLLPAEPTPDNPSPPLIRMTYFDLYNLVADSVSALLQQGLKPGDRVASYSSNCIVSRLSNVNCFSVAKAVPIACRKMSNAPLIVTS